MMLGVSYILLVAVLYGQQNTAHAQISSLGSVDLIQPVKQEDKANKTFAVNAETEKKATTTDVSDHTMNVNEQQLCTDYRAIEGVCVPYYKCNSSNLNGDNAANGFIDINGAAYSLCTSFLDVCCFPEDVMLDSPSVKPDQMEDTTYVNKSCGRHNPNGVGPIIVGVENSTSTFGEFPWTVAVLRGESLAEKEIDGQKLNVYLGGGSLIHPNVVLTAAHVVSKDKELRVRAGEWDTQSTKEIYPHQDRDVKEVVLHPEFMAKNLHNDIALLFLSHPVDLSPPHVGVACLPNGDMVDYASKASCFASGWGKDRFGKKGRYFVLLKKVELPLVEHETCQSRLRTTRLGARFQLDSSFLCAGGEAGKDTCIGDGGAPLVCPLKDHKDKYVQNGIVAWGISCGNDGIPGVYVDVANFRSWIDETVVRHGYDPKIYNV